MDVTGDGYFQNSLKNDRTDSPLSQNSTPNSIDVTEQISLSQHQQNIDTLNRMGIFYSQMTENALKSRFGLTQVPSSSQPRHTIDAILGLERKGQVDVVSEFSNRREGDRMCEGASVSPSAVESAGKS